MDRGKLSVRVYDRVTLSPIEAASVNIAYSGDPDSQIERAITDESGKTQEIELAAPELEYSMEPGDIQPYAEYTVTVERSGYQTKAVSGTEVFPGKTAVLEVLLDNRSGNIVIPANTLWGNYPPKIAESEVKQVNRPGEIVLSRVVVPETIVVHDGVPSDPTARDYYVRYRDYIKNVASSEIYATWPDATLRANILAIMSFTLNRVYTEWYRNQGYNFTITSSTAFDHKWIYGRNIFENISEIVDEIFDCYMSRPNVKQPILTQYCDGKRSSCPTWMTQWGSKALGDQGYLPIEILRYYYGENIYINRAEEISGIPASWPGYNLDIGSSGEKVRQIQEQLNRVGDNYRKIPKLAVDGIYGENTANAVKIFQEIFDMPRTGVVDFPTWYKISDMYVRLTRISELQ